MSAVSEQYAVALFELSLEAHQLDDVYKAFQSFKCTLDEEVQTFFLHPNINKTEKDKVIDNSEYPSLFKDFLKVIIHNNRMKDIPTMYEAFKKFVEEQASLMHIHVYTAKPLSKDQTSALQATYKKKYNRDIEVETHVDASIVGGMRIEYNGMVLNDTVNYRLNKLKSRLKK